MMKALLFGSIGTLAETSELQRTAFNQAFAEHKLDWHWSRAQYQAMLKESGGKQRVERYAALQSKSVDAGAVHTTKSKIFQQLLRTETIGLRPGVADTLRQARASGVRVGLVTTTSPENVSSLLAALPPEAAATSFDVVVDRSLVEAGKPAPDAYRLALERLGVSADEAIAIEDNQDGLAAALAAGVACYAFGGENTQDHAFEGAVAQLSTLRFDQLTSQVS